MKKKVVEFFNDLKNNHRILMISAISFIVVYYVLFFVNFFGGPIAFTKNFFKAVNLLMLGTYGLGFFCALVIYNFLRIKFISIVYTLYRKIYPDISYEDSRVIRNIIIWDPYDSEKARRYFITGFMLVFMFFLLAYPAGALHIFIGYLAKIFKWSVDSKTGFEILLYFVLVVSIVMVPWKLSKKILDNSSGRLKFKKILEVSALSYLITQIPNIHKIPDLPEEIMCVLQSL